MKLTRNSTAPAIILGLFVGLAGACGSKKPPGTNPPGEPGAAGGDGDVQSDRGDGDPSDGTGDEPAAPANDGGADGGAPKQCDAKVADTPTLLFGDQVIIRPPTGVEFQVDDNPMVQQAMMSGGFMSACDAIVKRMIITVYEMDKKKKPAKLLEEFISSLEQQGYKGGTMSSPYLDTATDYHLSVEYAGGGGSPATVLYLGVARRTDKDFIVVMETTPAEFEALKPTFQESAKSLFVVPPDA